MTKEENAKRSLKSYYKKRTNRLKNMKNWQKRNPIRQKELQKQARARRTAFILSFKINPCLDCKNIYPPVCMQFDHARGEKLFDIGDGSRCSMPDLLKEIAKCDVVCANCHLIRGERRRLKNG